MEICHTCSPPVEEYIVGKSRLKIVVRTLLLPLIRLVSLVV